MTKPETIYFVETIITELSFTANDQTLIFLILSAVNFRIIYLFIYLQLIIAFYKNVLYREGFWGMLYFMFKIFLTVTSLKLIKKDFSKVIRLY